MAPPDEDESLTQAKREPVYWQCLTDVEHLKDFWIDTVFAAPAPLRRDGYNPGWQKLGERREITFKGEPPRPYVDAADIDNSFGLLPEEERTLRDLFGRNEVPPPPAGTCCHKFQWDKARENRFLAMGGRMATVRRNGKDEDILDHNIVPGDLLRIRLGSEIPCDCRVVAVSGGFTVATVPSPVVSAHYHFVSVPLSGCLPSVKPASDCEEQKKKYAGSGRSVGRNDDSAWRKLCADTEGGIAKRQHNIITSAQQVTQGECWAVAVATGEWTVMGRAYQLAIDKEFERNPPTLCVVQ